jgi:hypothetical protein
MDTEVSLGQTRPMRDERCDADVILDVVFDRGLLFLVVANTGGRPAHSVVKIEGPSLNATANEVAIETLELAHEGLESSNPRAEMPAPWPAPASHSSGLDCGSRAPQQTAGRGRGCRRS